MRSVLLIVLCCIVAAADIVAQPHVVINEIMYAPIAPEPEWVELVNITDDSAQLHAYTLGDAVRSVRFPAMFVPGHGFVVVTKDTALLRQRYPSIAAPMMQAAISTLNNTGDIVTLRDTNGILVDSVAYSPSEGGAHGRSLERIDAFALADSSNLEECTDRNGATPGMPNSVRRRDRDIAVSSIEFDSLRTSTAYLQLEIINRGRLPLAGVSYRLREDGSAFDITQGIVTDSIAPLSHRSIPIEWFTATLGRALLSATVTVAGDETPSNDTLHTHLQIPIPEATLVINELMYAPNAGLPQWVELDNQSPSAVDLSGSRFVVRRDDSDHVFYMHSMHIRPLEYGVIAASIPITDPPPLNLGPTDTLDVPSLQLGLENCSVVLRDPFGSVVDSVTLDPSSLSTQLTSSSTGISLERKHADLPGSVAENWGSCVDPRGATPYEKNSVSVDSVGETFTVDARPHSFSPDGDGFDDYTTIYVRAPDDYEHVADIAIYDSRGRFVRSLAQSGRFVGSRGFAFDGRDEHGKILGAGLFTARALIEGHTLRTGIVVSGRRR
ncbi:MAG: lamin tail domain-containing protein [Bacteroidetes bacterium]|nr:lamin tail domain-containing protein [Bacteroidota bacterium]